MYSWLSEAQDQIILAAPRVRVADAAPCKVSGVSRDHTFVLYSQPSIDLITNTDSEKAS